MNRTRRHRQLVEIADLVVGGATDRATGLGLVHTAEFPEDADLLARTRTLAVRTERLRLRPADVDDLEATWCFRQLDEVSRWLTRAPRTLDGHRAQFEDPASLAKTLVIDLDGVVIGDLMLAVEDAWSQAEAGDAGRQAQADLGWALHPDHTGRGYATEAVRAVLRLCFERLGIRRVTASCFAGNEASWRLMERVGMRREGHAVRDALHRSGEWMDTLSYALLAEEWRPASATAGATPG